jgi:hypothetical protein
MMMEKVDDTQDTNCHLGQHGYKFQVHVLVEGTQRTTASSNSSRDDGDEIGREPEEKKRSSSSFLFSFLYLALSIFFFLFFFLSKEFSSLNLFKLKRKEKEKKNLSYNLVEVGDRHRLG